MSNPTCGATTKSGAPCKNTARDDSAYCYAHRNFTVAAEAPVEEPIIVEEEVTEEASSASEDGFNKLVNDLNDVVEELRKRAPDFVPPSLSPQAVVDLVRENLEKMPRPDVDSKLVNDLQEQVKDKSAQDFLDPETWQGLWYVVNASMQEQAGSLRTSINETMTTQMDTLRNSEAYADLKENVQIESPQDFLEPKTWKGLFDFANETLQSQAKTIRQRMQRNQEEA